MAGQGLGEEGVWQSGNGTWGKRRVEGEEGGRFGEEVGAPFKSFHWPLLHQ